MTDELIVYLCAIQIKRAFLDKVNVIFIYSTTERMETNFTALEGTFFNFGSYDIKKGLLHPSTQYKQMIYCSSR